MFPNNLISLNKGRISVINDAHISVNYLLILADFCIETVSAKSNFKKGKNILSVDLSIKFPRLSNGFSVLKMSSNKSLLF